MTTKSLTFEILARDQASAKFKSLGDNVEKSGSKLSRFGGGMAKAGKAMAVGLAGGAVAAGIVGKKLIDAGERASTSNSRIEQITKSMGLFGDKSDEVSGRLEKLANQQALQTGIDQNAIKETQAKLMTFSNLAKSADKLGGTFDQTTQLAEDMQAAGFGSAQQSAVMLGKALQDPANGLSALTRVGVTFTAEQQKQIKAMQANGDAAGAQKLMLKAMQDQVGGTAVATANGTDKMKVAFSQVMEAVGSKLLPIVNKFANWIINVGMPAAAKFGHFFMTKILPPIMKVAHWIGQHLMPTFHTMGKQGPSMLDKIKSALSPVMDAFKKLVGFVIPVVKQIADFIKQHWGTISSNVKTIFGEIWSVIKGVLGLISTEIGIWVAVFSFIWKHWGNTIMTVVGDVWKIVAGIIKGALKVIGGILKVATSLLKGDWKGAWDGIKQIFSGVWDAIKSVLGGAWDIIKDTIGKGIGWVVDKISGIGGKITSAASGMWDGIKDAFKGVVNWIIDAWNGLHFSIPSVDTHIPGVGKIGGFTLEVPQIPRLYRGGIVQGSAAGTAVIAGDRNQSEAIVPLSQYRHPHGLRPLEVHVHGPGWDQRTVQALVQAVREEDRKSGGNSGLLMAPA